jgi:hypothetical protein
VSVALNGNQLVWLGRITQGKNPNATFKLHKDGDDVVLDYTQNDVLQGEFRVPLDGDGAWVNKVES